MDFQPLLETFTGLSSLFAFLSGLIVGDTTSLGFAFLASQKIIPLWETALFGLIGIVVADFIFYLIGRTSQFTKFTKKKIFKKLFKKVDDALDKISGKNPFLAILYTKFTIGTKFLISSYLGQRKVPFFKYICCSISASLLWAIVLVGAGYLAGQGFLWLLNLFENLPIAGLFFFILGGIFVHFNRKAHHKIIRKINKENAKLQNKKR